jgi:hypothetical protein
MATKRGTKKKPAAGLTEIRRHGRGGQGAVAVICRHSLVHLP